MALSRDKLLDLVQKEHAQVLYGVNYALSNLSIIINMNHQMFIGYESVDTPNPKLIRLRLRKYYFMCLKPYREQTVQ